MKERPIIFSPDMVRAILDGRKTQTRRVIRFKKWPDCPVIEMTEHNGFKGEPANIQRWTADHQAKKSILIEQNIKCPYGLLGDRLWVREAYGWAYDEQEKAFCVYRATADGIAVQSRWHASIHMPRTLSRITLEITDVRVERLRQISDEDCLAEGITKQVHIMGMMDTISLNQGGFFSLWNSIQGKKYPWESNPWVWVICFKWVKP